MTTNTSSNKPRHLRLIPRDERYTDCGCEKPCLCHRDPRAEPAQKALEAADPLHPSPEAKASWERAMARESERMAKVAEASHYTGAKYESGRDIKEIAKLVRKDIKAARKAGDLPAAKYSVRISRYSMGRSLTVTVSGLEMEVANMERFRAEARDPNLRHLGAPVGRLMTDEAYALEAKVEALVNAYNFDKSDLATDYHNRAFHGFVSIEADFGAARERAEAELNGLEGTPPEGCWTRDEGDGPERCDLADFIRANIEDPELENWLELFRATEPGGSFRLGGGATPCVTFARETETYLAAE